MKFRCYLEEVNDFIYLSDAPDDLKEKKKEGKAVVLLLTEESRGADFSSFPFALELGEEDMAMLAVSLSAGGSALSRRPGEEGHAMPAVSSGCTCTLEQLEEWIDPSYLERVWARHAQQPLIITETERLLIRELSKADGEALLRLLDGDGIRQFLPGLGREKEEICQGLQAYAETVYDITGYGIFGVCGRANPQELIGIVSLIPRTAEAVRDWEEKSKVGRTERTIQNRTVGSLCASEKAPQGMETYTLPSAEPLETEPSVLELGFALGQEHQKKGYAVEMSSAVLKHFGEAGISFVAYTDPENVAAKRVLEKLGFKEI